MKYGPDFPDVTLADMASAQERLLAHLGVRRLTAVIGYSFGGQLTLQWAASRPERAGAAAVIASGLRSSSAPEAITSLQQRFAACADGTAGTTSIDSEYGHFAPTADWRHWGGALGDFLARPA